jgi:hypothetical protein
MTSIENLYSNLNDLSKPKSIIETPSNYNESEENILEFNVVVVPCLSK